MDREWGQGGLALGDSFLFCSTHNYPIALFLQSKEELPPPMEPTIMAHHRTITLPTNMYHYFP